MVAIAGVKKQKLGDEKWTFPHLTVVKHAVRFPFWLACFLAVAGTAWRSPSASVALLTIFLALLLVVEWASRRMSAKWRTVKKMPKLEMTEPMDGTVRQQMIRTTTAEGEDRFDGTFLAEFPAQARTTTIHIPFCPAFDQVPKVQVFLMDEADALLRIISPKVFGVRVDIKRNNLEIDRLCFAVIAEG